MIEAHLDECVRCSIEVAQHHEVAGLLANSGGAPPAGLWDGIAGQLDGTSTPRGTGWPPGSTGPATARTDRSSDRRPERDGADRGADLDRSRRRSPLVRLRAPGLVAAAAAVVALVLGVQVHHLHHQVSALQARPAAVGGRAGRAGSTRRPGRSR